MAFQYVYTSANRSLAFKVTRRAPELLRPARPTPHEFKELSDVDNLENFRHHTPLILFYRNEAGHSLSERDPAKVIKDAVAKALVWYYPLAGRLRETKGRKLVVECNEEGIMFIEADADVCIDDFGEALLPPFPCLDELLFDVPGSSAVLGTPLILIQVTRLKCDGFILGFRLNHTMADGQGIVQFMKAVAELARGAQSPSIQPVWERHLLTSRNLPRSTCEPIKFDKIATNAKGTIIPQDDIVHKSFFFGPSEIAALKRFIPPHLKSSRTSTFDILTACIWRCRVIALKPDPEEKVPLKCVVNARTKCDPPLPNGYYGNAFTYAIALPTARELSSNSIGYALELIKKAKAEVAQNYLTSFANLIVMNGMLHLSTIWSFVVSDTTRLGMDNEDFGWGPPAYAAPAKSGVGIRPGIVTFYVRFQNIRGEKGIAVPICLRRNEMDIFVKELNKLLRDVPEDPISGVRSSSIISSSL